MTKQKVSVVVVTKDRASSLQHCLGSLAAQNFTLEELIIIDNNSTDTTREVVKNFSKKVLFPVNYFIEKKVGYPHIYNRGLLEATGDFVAFIDDDCIADVSWYKNIHAVVSRVPQVSAVLGRSVEYFSTSIFALAKSFIDETGKIGAIQSGRVFDLEILDSKNIAYNKAFLKKNNLNFDESLVKYGQGASADCDLGMQIQRAGGIAVYNKHMKIWHKDPTGYGRYFRKAFSTLRNHLIYEKKWEKVRYMITTKRPYLEILEQFVVFGKRYRLSIIGQVLVAVVVFITFLYIKILRKLLNREIVKMKVRQA